MVCYFSFIPSPLCLCQIMHVCVGAFTVCSNLIQNKVTQQNTESERCSSSASLRWRLKQIFFFSDSAYVSMLDGKLYMMFSNVYYSEAASEKRPSNKFTLVIFIHPHHCRSSLIFNNRRLIQVVAVSNYSRAWILSASAPKHTSVAIATHTHLNHFSCLAYVLQIEMASMKGNGAPPVWKNLNWYGRTSTVTPDQPITRY